MTLLDAPQICGSRDLTEIYSVFRGNRDCDPALFRARITQRFGEFHIRTTVITIGNCREIAQQVVEHYEVAKFSALVALEKAAEAYVADR
jgi:hypothetical protein